MKRKLAFISAVNMYCILKTLLFPVRCIEQCGLMYLQCGVILL